MLLPLAAQMYKTCLDCDRSLGTNTHLKHMPVGRRIAFDERTGRLWLICLHCRQWNLVPIEIRWEAVEECMRVAAEAESRVQGTGAGFARTESGLELLSATAFSRVDIANWRYGRNVKRRMRGLWMTFGAFGLAAAAIGLNAAVAGGSVVAGVWTAALVATLVWHSLRKPSRVWIEARVHERRMLLPGWRLSTLGFAKRNGGVVLIVPGWFGDVELSGHAAARALHSLLPVLNDVDCLGASIADAVGIVAKAEGQQKVRPWEWIAARLHGAPVLSATPTERLALEMAVAEELERHALAARARDAQRELEGETVIGEIADELLLQERVRARVRMLTRRRTAERDVGDQ